MMIPQIGSIKEKCLGCDKYIWTHNEIVSCNSCMTIIHAKCARSLFNHNHMDNSWHCFQCLSKPPKYNPFSALLHDKYDPNTLADIEDLHEISKILENCTMYDKKSFNKLS